MTFDCRRVMISDMNERDCRTALLIGEEGVKKLKNSRVAVFGVGGVGSYCAEALARAGVGELLLVDKDTVEESNVNRQLVALYSTLGKPKAEVMAQRVRDISPDCAVTARVLFYLPETDGMFDFSGYDYLVDAIDNVTAKLSLICRAKREGIPVISAMGAGNKLQAEKLRVADISQTKVCPLARVMRKELKARGVANVKVVYSEEEPRARGETVGSVSFVPSVMGLLMAGEVIKDLIV